MNVDLWGIKARLKFWHVSIGCSPNLSYERSLYKKKNYTWDFEINLFLINVSIFYPLKTLTNWRFSGGFRGYEKGTVAQNGSTLTSTSTFIWNWNLNLPTIDWELLIWNLQMQFLKKFVDANSLMLHKYKKKHFKEFKYAFCIFGCKSVFKVLDFSAEMQFLWCVNIWI